MHPNRSKKIWTVVVPTVLAIAQLLLLLPLTSTDFWYDEVMSLEEFILVLVKKTLTDYPAPNNHIFFSLLMNYWLKLFGISSFAQAAENVWIVRLLPTIISAITVVAVYFTGKKIGGKYTGLLSAVSFMCILPFYNYGVQVRGYGLSMLLVALLANTVVSQYNTHKKIWTVLTALLIALFLYTIPSNLYPVLGLLAITGFCLVNISSKRGIKAAVSSPHLTVFIAATAGILLAITAYLPVMKQVLSNDYVKSQGLFRFGIFSDALHIFASILRPWYIILTGIIAGIVFSISKKKKQNTVITGISWVILLPFIISFIRGDAPFDRTFLWICPLLALVGGYYYNFIIETLIKNDFKKRIGLALFILFTVCGAVFGLEEIQEKLFTDVKNEVRDYSMYYNNIHSPVHTYQNLQLLKNKGYTDSTPVYLHEVDKYAMHGYLPALGINWEPYTDKIKSTNTYFIITAFPTKAKEEYLQYDSAFTFTQLNREVDFVSIIKAERIK